ncbi:MAG TPA: proton-conducting transporter membrane subunit [Candidatus Limnocylindrales bacterium]
MSLLVLLVASTFGAAYGLIARPSSPAGRMISLAALLVTFVAALFIGSGTSLDLGDVTLAGSRYSGLFLACIAGSALLLCVVSLAGDWHDEFAPAALAALAGAAIALTSTDAGVAFIAAAAASTAGALLITGTAPRAGDADGRASEMRTIAVVSGGLLVAAIAILRPAWAGNGDSPVFILAFAGFALALAIRGGVVPFHVPAVHLSRSALPMAPALLLVWIPAGIGLMAIAWSATTFQVQSDTLRSVAAIVEAVGIATLVLGALAALVHDDLNEIVTYSIVADAGFVLLAFAARTDLAAEPARLWLLVFIATKTALVAWAAALSRAYGTSDTGRLRGWLRRSPLLGVALIVIAVATIGWPGNSVYEARSALIRFALPGQLQFVFPISIIASAAYYLRLLAFGMLPLGEAVKAGESERPQLAPAAVEAEVALAAGPNESSNESPKDGDKVEAAGSVAVPSVAAAAETSTQVTATSTPETDVAAETADSPTPLEPAGGPSGAAARRGVPVILRLNRGLGVSLVVVAGAMLAAALGSGSLGAGDASQHGIPLDTAAHATPAPTHRPTAAPATPTPRVSLIPIPSYGPAGSGSSESPSIGSSGSPAPLKTSAPARDNTD